MLESLTQQVQALFFTRAQQQAFLEDLSTLIEDGVPANQAVETIAQIATGTVRDVASNILLKISQGKPIADGMQDWFSQPIVEIIRAGEEGGTLAENMAAAARALAQQTKGFSALLASITYPLAVIIMGMVVAVFIKHSVFVNFASIKPVSEWPANGRALVAIATFLESWWWVILLCVIALGVLLVRLLHELTGEPRQFLDSIPVISLYRDAMAARFMETLGLLLANGIVLKKALNILRYKANHYLAWHVYMMEFRLSGGRENIAEVIDTGLIRKDDVMRLKVIAKGKGFEHALIRLGRLSAERTGKNIELTGKMLGIILLAIGAGWAAFMIFAIYGVGSFVAT